MTKFRSLIISIFLIIFYTVLSANFEQSYGRYYFASYADLIDFFEHPCPATSKFVQQQTEFYADYHQMKTLNQVMTACVYENRDKTIGHFISHLETYNQKSLNDGHPDVIINKASYQKNVQFLDQSLEQQPDFHHGDSPVIISDQDPEQHYVIHSLEPELGKKSIIHWKVIAPNGQEHNSAEYDANPSKFNALWDPVATPVPGIPCKSEVVRRPDGRNSLQASFGDYGVCQNARAGFDSMEARRIAAVQEHQRKMRMPYVQKLQEAHNQHQNAMRQFEGKFHGNEKSDLIEKKEFLFSLKPPAYPELLTENNTFYLLRPNKGADYELALDTTDWLVGEIGRLTKACGDRRFKSEYMQAVDRIAQDFYKRYPTLKPKLFQAIRLSHAVAYRHYDTVKLTTLTEQWTNEGMNAGARSSLYKQRLKALQNTIRSKGIMRDYSGKVKKHAPFTDQDAAVFNNCYGTDLDQQLHEELCDTRIRMIEVVNHDKIYGYPDFYAPIVNRCTALAKEEKDVEIAFSLADYSDDLVTIVSKGIELLKSGLQAMHKGQMLVNECDEHDAFTQEDVRRVADFTIGTAYGTVAATAALATPEYWVDLATGMPILAFHTLVVLKDGVFEGKDLCLAALQKLRDPSSDALDKKCEHITQKIDQIKQSMNQSIKKLCCLSASELGEHVGYLGTRFVLDGAAINGLKLIAAPVGRKIVREIASVLESLRAEEAMTEVGLVCKVAVEKGIDNANMAVTTLKKNPSAFPRFSYKQATSNKLSQQAKPPKFQPYKHKNKHKQGKPNKPSQQAKPANQTQKPTPKGKQPVKPYIRKLKNTGNFQSEHALEHVLEGNLNGKGQAGGFHHEGIGKRGKIIPGTETPPNHQGVYTAKVTVDGVPKLTNGGKSTFFPKHWDAQEIVDAINEAFSNKTFVPNSRNTFRGQTAQGMKIDMYIDATTNKIISAFPTKI